MVEIKTCKYQNKNDRCRKARKHDQQGKVEKTTEIYSKEQSFENPQEQWYHLIKSCLIVGEDILGVKLK